jgi:hypothetical protein
MRKATLLLAANLFLSLLLGACAVQSDDADWTDDSTSTADDDYSETSSAVFANPMISFELPGSDADFLNPERGYYIGYNLRNAGDATSIRNAGYSLAIAIVKLEDYRDKALDSTLLTSLRNGFAKARTAGIKLVLRFTYNAAMTADASKSRILGHISQLTPLLRDNADVIAVLQAGFIGAWGEWHHSTNGLDTPAARGEILTALLASLPASRSVEVRTPMFKDTYRPGGPTSATEAYGGSSKARLGHHNDCFLASASDMGTYASPVSTWSGYVAADSLYTPAGGETCAVYTPKTSCAAAVAEMTSHHWSYLNHAYNATVVSSWTTGGCDATIRKDLGYRLALRQVAHNAKVAPGGILDLEMYIRNYGFAAPYNERPVDIVLTKGSTRLVARLPGVDARRLPAGLKTRVAARLRIPANLPVGTYTLAIRLPDASSTLAADPRYAIQLANAGSWVATTGDNVITRTLVVDAAAPGERDAGATTFVALP